MAVYTLLSQEQWQSVADGLGYEKLRWVAETRGTGDSKYVINLEKAGSEPVVAMLNIFETPDVHQNGVHIDQAKCLPKLVDYIRNYGIVRDQVGKEVRFDVPAPMIFKSGKSYMTMRFPSKIVGQKSVEKVIHVVRYIQGDSPKHYDNIAQTIPAAHSLGASNAAWLKAAKGFSSGRKFTNPFSVETWDGYANRLKANPHAIKKLALKLQDECQNVDAADPNWEKQAEEQLTKLYNAVKYITTNWRKKTQNLTSQIIHGDPFPDNCITTSEGKVVVVDNGSVFFGKNTDIAMGLNAAAMGPDGELDINVAASYLQAFDNVSPLLEAEKQTLEFLGQVAAIRWCLSRAMLIANAPEGTIIKKRSLAGLLKQFDFWHKAEINNEKIADKLLSTSLTERLDEISNMKAVSNQINLVPENNLLQIPGKATYYPLLHALRCKHIGEQLGAFIVPTLTFSRPVSALTKQSCYLFSGLDIVPGSKDEKIKNYQVLGYIVEAIWPIYEQLKALSPRDLFLRKKNFLYNRPNASEDALDKIQPLHLAIWESFSHTPIVTPTSGNFGLAALDWLEKLRSFNIAENVPLLAADEGHVVLWLPKPTDITRSKLDEVTTRANALNTTKLENGKTYGVWNNTTDRDPDSLIYALHHGAYYWQTNPFSAADIKHKLLDEVVSRVGEDILFTTQARFTLEAMGCEVKDNRIDVYRGSLGGQHGLMLPRLIIENLTVAQPHKTIVIPPSAGGTAAACIEAGRMLKEIAEHTMTQSRYFDNLNEKIEFDSLLEDYFPKLSRVLSARPDAFLKDHNTRIILARHTGNDNLVKGLKLHDQPTKSLRYVSGIGSVAPMKYPTEVFKHSLTNGGELHSEGDIIPTPIVFTKIAQILIFKGKQDTDPQARMPEEAAAIPVGALLYQAYSQNKCNENDIAQMLRRLKVTKESFIHLVGDEFYKNEYDGAELDGLIIRILNLLDSNSFANSSMISSNQLDNSTICYVTGNTGTKQVSAEDSRIIH